MITLDVLLKLFLSGNRSSEVTMYSPAIYAQPSRRACCSAVEVLIRTDNPAVSIFTTFPYFYLFVWMYMGDVSVRIV